MTYPLSLRPEAEADIEETSGWYEQRRVGLGNAFLLSVEDAIDRLREFPELYALVYKDLRRCRLKRFPYVMYYRFTNHRVEIVAVVHGHRHERVWKSRAE